MSINAQLIMLCLLFLLLPVETFAADWQLSGVVEQKGVGETMFFDRESVENSAEGTVRVWTKSISNTEFHRYWKSKAIVNKVASKIANYYCPAFMSVPSVEKRYEKEAYADACMEFTAYEVVANEGVAPASAKIYWEIDCKNKRMRSLQTTLFDSKGNIKGQGRNSPEFHYVEPDTNGQWLSQLVCG